VAHDELTQWSSSARVAPRRLAAAAHDELTRWSSSAQVAPRRLAATASFVLHSRLACVGSKGSPVTKRPQAGAAASPRARRGLQFVWDST
jgi:hypothetical protein